MGTCRIDTLVSFFTTQTESKLILALIYIHKPYRKDTDNPEKFREATSVRLWLEDSGIYIYYIYTILE